MKKIPLLLILFCHAVLLASDMSVGVINTPFFLEVCRDGFKGPVYEIISEIAETEDWKLHLISADRDRLFQMLYEGRIDFVLPVPFYQAFENGSELSMNKYSLIPSKEASNGLYALFNVSSSGKFDIMMSLDHRLSQWKKNFNSGYYEIISEYLSLSPERNGVFNLGIALPVMAGLLVFAALTAFFGYFRHTQIRKTHAKLSVIETHNQEIMQKTSEMIELISILGTEKLEENSFLRKLLDMAVSIIPEASYGSILMRKDDGSWNFVCTRGHRIELLENLSMGKNYFFPIKGPIVMDNISNIFFERMPLELARKIYKSMLPIKSTIMMPLRAAEEIVGYMMVDIPQKSPRDFSDSSVNIMKSLSPLASSFMDFRRMEKKQYEFQESIVRSLVKLLELRDAYTSGHSGRVAFYARKIGEGMGLKARTLDNIYWAGLLHDIGKVLVDRGILNKPAKLTEEEFEQIKMHPVIGSEVLRESSQYAPLSHIVLYHHESWNGKGYPEGLKGGEIPLESRIISVADTFDAMTTDRPYRKAISCGTALAEIEKMSGIQFDPQVVGIFKDIFDTLVESNVKTAI